MSPASASASASDDRSAALDRAANIVRDARALILAAGAGMGVDSGLPDFRGPEGFWRAHPPYRALGLRFEELANPDWFVRDPRLAWGFYGHRAALYRRTPPHRGFEILRRWAAAKPGGAFVYTSNVDGHFQRAGFPPERVMEVHGSLARLQCLAECGQPPIPRGFDDDLDPELDVDPATLRARGPLPRCPACGELLRPNILMFGDWGWDSRFSDEQAERLKVWLAETRRADQPVAILEFGAGLAVPTVRRFSERISRASGWPVVRVNPREPELPGDLAGAGAEGGGGGGGVELPIGALEALLAIDARLAPADPGDAEPGTDVVK